MMLYIAELWDYFYDMSCVVGAYTTMQKAEDAIDLIIRWAKKRDPGNVPESRFDWQITPVPVNMFTEAVTEWIGDE